MKKLMKVVLGLMFAVSLAGVAIAGSIDSQGAPSVGSGMYTLQNLYDYLRSGTALTVQTGFQEPTSGPGSTMKTTKEIGDAIKDKFNLCAATADNVEQGVTFFCTQPGSWGVQTGTLSALPRPTATPTQTPTPTLTPTPTVTPTVWDSAACEAKSGFWASMHSSTGGSGCWFVGTKSASDWCTDICSRHGLTCKDGDWDVSSAGANDPVCNHYCSSTSGEGGDGHPDYPECESLTGAKCLYRGNNPVHASDWSCAAHVKTEGYASLCVCEP